MLSRALHWISRLTICRRFAQSDVLFQRRRAERSAAAHGAINGARLAAFVLHRHFDSCSDGRAVSLHAHQPEADPIVAVPRVFEQPERVAVARSRAADHREQIFVAIVVDIRERYAVSLV